MPARTKPKTTKLPGAPPEPFVERGTSGLHRWGGQIHEEFLLDLRGTKGRKMYREMSENDPVIGAVLFVIKMLFRGVPITVTPGGTSPQDIEAADLVKTCLDDMSLTWADTLSDILTMFPYGWAFLEVVYKRREGAEGETRSRYSDGKIGWRKWALRSQQSLQEWEFDDAGGIRGLKQVPDLGRPGVVIPIEKALLFKTENAGGNPEGRSILRNSYIPYYFSKQIRISEGIGVQRDFAGMPVIKIPSAFMASDATSAEQAVYEAYKTMGERVTSDQQSCVVIPSDRDENGHPQYEFSLASSGSKRNFDLGAIIARYNVEKALPVLGDFVLMGHEKVGSFALSDGKMGMFGAALEGWIDAILAVPNRYEIPRLLALNGLRVENPPQFAHGKIIPPSIKELSEAIATLVGGGMPLFPDDAIESALRERMGLPMMEGSDPTTGQRTMPRGPTAKPKVGSAEWRAQQQAEADAGDQAQKAFDESLHPRHPKGENDGGKFAPKGGGSTDPLQVDEAATRRAAVMLGLREPVQDQELLGDPGFAANAAARDLNRLQFNPASLEAAPIGSIIIGTQGEDAAAMGAYNYQTETISIVSPTDTRSFLHEFAHHLDGSFGIGGSDDVVDQPAVLGTWAQMTDEWRGARSATYAAYLSSGGKPLAASESHLDWGDTWRAMSRAAVPRVGPSYWALSGSREWFAESFAEYVYNPGSREGMRQSHPATARAIEGMIDGRWLRPRKAR